MTLPPSAPSSSASALPAAGPPSADPAAALPAAEKLQTVEAIKRLELELAQQRLLRRDKAASQSNLQALRLIGILGLVFLLAAALFALSRAESLHREQLPARPPEAAPGPVSPSPPVR